MSKKAKANITTTQATETTPMEVAAAEAIDRPDPTLLGVSVPLSLTFAATKQVMDAWRECFQALSLAVKAKLAKPEVSLEAAPIAPVVEA